MTHPAILALEDGTVFEGVSVGLLGQHLHGRGLGRHHGDPAAALGQHAQDVALDAEVVGHHVETRLGAHEPAGVEVELAFGPGVTLAGADFLGQVHARQARELARGLDGGVVVDVVAGRQLDGSSELK